MTDHHAWRERDRYLFGRDRSVYDLLDRHLARTGGDRAVRDDPMANFQVTVLRNFLDVLRAALDDEHVDPDTGLRVIERVIYGGVPRYAEVEERLRQQKLFAERLAMKPPDTSWLVTEREDRK